MARRVYEKGPQSLADAIREVEKLQAAQQLTATLLPSSSVDIMSSNDDKCFQCQELGHMAYHCPHIKCFDCGEYGHITADCQTRSHCQIHLQGTEILMQDAMIDLHLVMTIETGHITDAHTEAHCTTGTQAHIAIDETLHIEDPHHTEVIQHIPEMVANVDHVPHIRTPT